MGSHPWAAGERGRLALLTVTSVGAVLYPLRQYLRTPPERVDGFPLSYYPMFSKRRKNSVKVVYARCLHADGNHHPLSHDVLGSGGFNQVRHQVNRLVRLGKAQAYATGLATRLSGRTGCHGIGQIEIVRVTVDIDACMLNRQIGGQETILASAALPSPTAIT